MRNLFAYFKPSIAASLGRIGRKSNGRSFDSFIFIIIPNSLPMSGEMGLAKVTTGRTPIDACTRAATRSYVFLQPWRQRYSPRESQHSGYLQAFQLPFLALSIAPKVAISVSAPPA